MTGGAGGHGDHHKRGSRRISVASSVASKVMLRSSKRKSSSGPRRPVSTYFNKVARNIISTSGRVIVMNKPNLRRSSLALHRMTSSKHFGHDGFEDLCHFNKQGTEFTKDLVQTLNERAELEMNYAKGLAKLSAKLFKASKDLSVGTVSNAWHFIAEDMESSSSVHKSMAEQLVNELVRPLRTFSESQHKSRKSVETLVEKRSKSLNEWRNSEAKTKSKCYANCRDNERLQDQLLDCKLGRGRVLSEKELVKLESKRRKSEEAVKKSDLDYYACCIKAERARLDWESSILRGSSVFRHLEQDRLDQLKTLAVSYHHTMAEHRPRLVNCSNKLAEPIDAINVNADMETVNKKMNIDAESLGDQILPSFYSEDATNSMNAERRREALAKFLKVIKSDIEREKKAMAGVENLAKAIRETPKFGNEESQQDVEEKLQHMRSMLTFLEACRFKVLNSLLDMEGRPKVTHPLSSKITTDRDKSGMYRTVLKLPYVARMEPQQPIDEYPFPISSCSSDDASSSTSASVRSSSMSLKNANSVSQQQPGRARSDYPRVTQLVCPNDFASVALEESVHEYDSEQQVVHENGNHEDNNSSSSDFDDFSDDEGDQPVNIIQVVNGGGGHDHHSHNHHHHRHPHYHNHHDNTNSTENEVDEIYIQEKTVPSLGQCRAIYDYTANMYDELTIRVGDIINIHDKQEDGWWLGELNGTVGIFPATYVEEQDE